VGLFNETLSGRWNEIIRRLHQVKRVPSPQIAPEIVHDITLESDRPEWHVLHGGFLWATRTAQAAVAAVLSFVGIRNPTGSGILVVIERIRVNNPGLAAGDYFIYASSQSADGALGTGPTFIRDSRRPQGSCPVLSLTGTNAASLGVGSIEELELEAATGERDFMSPPYVLAPGADLLVRTSAVNLPINCNFVGYARPVTPEELNIL